MDVLTIIRGGFDTRRVMMEIKDLLITDIPFSSPLDLDKCFWLVVSLKVIDDSVEPRISLPASNMGGEMKTR